MALQEELKQNGDFLFRFRSYLPLGFLPIFILAILTQDTYLYNPIKAYNDLLIIGALIIGLVGQGIRILVAGYAPKDTSGRNTKAQVANKINRSGIYSICRNPLYLGNALMMIAPVLLCGNWVVVLCFCLCFWLYYERIIYAEECFLRKKFGQSYLDWANTTPIFIPKFKGYVPNAESFSLRSMLRREYHSFFGLTSSLFVIHFMIMAIECLKNGGKIAYPHCLLSVLFVLSVVFYLIIRFLAKKTNLLNAKGR